jgi:hypothetical protein
MPNPLLMADVKPSSSVPAYTKGVIYYINAAAKTISALPSTEGASGFTAVSLAAAKSDGGGSCVTALGFPRPNLVTLLATGANYDMLFASSYDFLVSTPTSATGTLLMAKLTTAEVERLVPAKYKSSGIVALNVALKMGANMVMGSAGGDPLLYFYFLACKAGGDCYNAYDSVSTPYGDILLGIRANLNAATGASRLLTHRAAAPPLPHLPLSQQ